MEEPKNSNYTANLFIPEALFKTSSGWLLGWWIGELHPIVYVLAVLHSSEPSNDKLSDRSVTPEGRVGFMPVILGKFENNDIDQENANGFDVASLKQRSPLCLHLRVSTHKLQICVFWYRNTRLKVLDCCKIFQYETLSLLSSELLVYNTSKDLKQYIFLKEDFDNYNCVEKLLVVLHQWKQFRLFEIPDISDTLKVARISPGIHPPEKMPEIQNERQQNIYNNSGIQWNRILNWLPYFKKVFWKILFCSAFFRQLYQRFHQLSYAIKINETERGFRKCLRCHNVILSVFLDVILGILLLHKLLELFSPIQLLELFMVSTDHTCFHIWAIFICLWQIWEPCTESRSTRNYNNYFVVDHLQTLLHWLMGVPAGLKLNYPLNSALGQFFLYHIYLWKTYITVVKPLLQYMLEALTLFGWLGVSFQMSLFSDLMSLATFHVYCFYVYAARLYHLHLSGLLSLWRLVRGRKWNPLRRRVDSCAYTTDQLYLGTITFMILLFLMPTTFLYYCVFSSLRLSILAVLGILHYIIYLISTAPFYAILLFLKKSNKLAGEVNFTVVCDNGPEHSVVLSLKNSPSCLKKIWNMTKPLDFVPRDRTSWGKLLKNLLLGRLIYPF